jgi:hypothetical protein
MVVANVPTADELRTISLRLYFKAWSDVASIVTEWSEYGAGVPPEAEDEDGAWQKYIEAAQSDLQSIYTLIQQSQEIGLKALICEVSPYLLLKKTDVRPVDANLGVWDFTDFQTADAGELIRLINTFCSRAISKRFEERYNEIRKNRNKIAHLGIYRELLEPDGLIDILLEQYQEVYPGRRWMEDRLHFAALHRWSDLEDGDFNERTTLFHELWHLLEGSSDGQFKWLMGHERDEQRFICHSCVADAKLGGRQPYGYDVPTAYRVGDKLAVKCVVCDAVYAMLNAKCPNDECDSELLSAEASNDAACMKCGMTQKRWDNRWRAGEESYVDYSLRISRQQSRK